MVKRVLRSRDGRVRIEIHDNRLATLYDHGFLILRRATLDEVGEWLARAGVTATDLVED